MKNWKTTVAGIATIVAGVAGAVKLWAAGDLSNALTALLGGVSAGIGLMTAKDAKTGEGQ